MCSKSCRASGSVGFFCVIYFEDLRSHLTHKHFQNPLFLSHVFAVEFMNKPRIKQAKSQMKKRNRKTLESYIEMKLYLVIDSAAFMASHTKQFEIIQAIQKFF